MAENVAKLVGIALGTLFRFWAYRRFVFSQEPLSDTSPLAESTSRRAHRTAAREQVPEPIASPLSSRERKTHRAQILTVYGLSRGHQGRPHPQRAGALARLRERRRGDRAAPRDARPGERRCSGSSPTHDLDIMRPGQALDGITARVARRRSTACSSASGPTPWSCRATRRPRFAAALAAFYASVPVGHLEAGLRTDDLDSPFPEEINRRLTAQLATLHLAPTLAAAREPRSREDIDPAPHRRHRQHGDRRAARRRRSREPVPLGDAARSPARRAAAAASCSSPPTAARSWGEPMAAIGRALAADRRRFPDARRRLPGPPQPGRPRGGHPPTLGGARQRPRHRAARLRRVRHAAAPRRTSSLTDSGGVQEEAPEPRQAGAGHARHHRAARGGRRRHRAARRHRRGAHRRRGRAQLMTDDAAIRRDGARRSTRTATGRRANARSRALGAAVRPRASGSRTSRPSERTARAVHPDRSGLSSPRRGSTRHGSVGSLGSGVCHGRTDEHVAPTVGDGSGGMPGCFGAHPPLACSNASASAASRTPRRRDPRASRMPRRRRRGL